MKRQYPGKDSENKYLFSWSMLTIVMLILIFPVIYVGRYAYPWADDFTYGTLPHIAFSQTGSIVFTLWAAIKDTIDTYFGWQGTYTSCFLMEMHPAGFSMKMYHMTSFIMLGAMFVSYFALFRVIGKNVLKKERMDYELFILTFLFSVELVDGKAEGFTWYNSAIHYTFGHALFVLFLALLIKYVFSQEETRTLLVFASICGFLAAGVNNITVFGGMLFLSMVILFLVFTKLIFGEKDFSFIKKSLIPTASFMAGALINLLAPGNRSRMATSDAVKNSIFVTIRNSFVLGFHFCLRHVRLEVLGFMILAGILIWKTFSKLQKENTFHFRFPFPLLVSVLSFCLISALYSPFAFIETADISSEYIDRQLGVNRVSDSVFYVFILLILLNEFYCIGWLFFRKQLSYKKEIGVALGAVATIMIVLSCVRIIAVYPERYLTSAAIYGIKNGTAVEYGEIMEENVNRFQSSEQNVEILPITAKPDILYPRDAAAYKDGAVLFFEKESVYYKE